MKMENFSVLRQGFSSEIDPLNEDAMDLIFGGDKVITCNQGYSVSTDDKGNPVLKCGCGYSCVEDDGKVEKPDLPPLIQTGNNGSIM